LYSQAIIKVENVILSLFRTHRTHSYNSGKHLFTKTVCDVSTID